VGSWAQQLLRRNRADATSVLQCAATSSSLAEANSASTRLRPVSLAYLLVSAEASNINRASPSRTIDAAAGNAVA
jgi:hypothetical protein